MSEAIILAIVGIFSAGAGAVINGFFGKRKVEAESGKIGVDALSEVINSLMQTIDALRLELKQAYATGERWRARALADEAFLEGGHMSQESRKRYHEQFKKRIEVFTENAS